MITSCLALGNVIVRLDFFPMLMQYDSVLS